MIKIKHFDVDSGNFVTCTEAELTCPRCGGHDLAHYDHKKRGILDHEREVTNYYPERMRCTGCGSYHTLYPDFIDGPTRYHADVIRDVITTSDYIRRDTYKDIPSISTINRWLKQKYHLF